MGFSSRAKTPAMDANTSLLCTGGSHADDTIEPILKSTKLHVTTTTRTNIPKAYEEIALVDGASRWHIYWHIVVPLSRPVFATVAIWLILTHLGDFLWPLLATRGDTYRPLMVGMLDFFNQAPLRWGDVMAFASMIVIPVLIMFLLLQKWFLRSAASTGIIG